MQPPGTTTRAASLQITGAPQGVATADTVRFTAVVRDGDGVVLPVEDVLWAVADTATAEVFVTGLAFGHAAGTTAITATVRGDTTIRASTALTVTPGAPVYDWVRYDLPEYLSDGWASGRQLFVAALRGRIFHFDGESWSDHVAAGGTDDGFVAIWGRDSADVYALDNAVTGTSGYHARVHHFDGSGWTIVQSLPHRGWSLWGAGAADLFVGGERALWHFDGSSWTPLATENTVTSIWAESGNRVFFSLATGGVRHFDGTSVSDVGGPPGNLALWGDGGVLFGAGGRDPNGLFRYHGPGDWRLVPSTAPVPLSRVSGTSATDVLVTGEYGHLRHYDGTALRTVWVRGAPVQWGARIAVAGRAVYIITGRTVLRGIRRE